MPTPDIVRLTLVRAPEDEASFSPGYQRELRQFYSLARAEGGKISAVTFTTDHADGGDGFVGEFLVPFTPVAGVHAHRGDRRVAARSSRAHIAPDNGRR